MAPADEADHRVRLTWRGLVVRGVERLCMANCKSLSEFLGFRETNSRRAPDRARGSG
jgi:hypothetical protein